MIGQTLDGYRIIEQLGQGGIATVYKAYDPNLGQFVAINVYRREISTTPLFLRDFKEKIDLGEKLRHPNIPSLLAYGEKDIVYTVYPYLQGNSLEQRLERGALPLEGASHILNQIASALDHVHKQEILHCDVKPTNIQLETAGTAYLIDWGRAIDLAKSSREAGTGTPGYAPLEFHLQNSSAWTPASDVYSLGITLYEMVTGRPPFQARDQSVILMKQLNDPLISPRDLRSELPEEAELLFFKVLEKEPKLRYQTAGALAAAFAQAIKDISPNNQGALVNLRDKLVTHFNLEGLRTLCFDLGIDSENFPSVKEGFCRELVSHHVRHGTISKLVDYCRMKRPDISW